MVKANILKKNKQILEEILTHPDRYLYEGNYTNIIKILTDVKRREKSYQLTDPQKWAIAHVSKLATLNFQISHDLTDVEELYQQKKYQEAYDFCFKLTTMMRVDRYKEYLQPYHKQKIFDKLRKIGDKLEEVPSDLPETSFTSHEKIKHPEHMKTTIAFHPRTTLESFSKSSEQKDTTFSLHSAEREGDLPSHIPGGDTFISQYSKSNQFKTSTSSSEGQPLPWKSLPKISSPKPAPLREFTLQVAEDRRTEIINFSNDE